MSLYRPYDGWEVPVDMERCRWAVHNDYGVRFHQCLRLGVVEVEVSGEPALLCRQHAKIQWAMTSR